MTTLDKGSEIHVCRTHSLLSASGSLIRHVPRSHPNLSVIVQPGTCVNLSCSHHNPSISASPSPSTYTLSNSPDCKRRLSRRHLLADPGIDQMRQRRKPVERFAVLKVCRFQPNARLQSDVLDSVNCHRTPLISSRVSLSPPISFGGCPSRM
jgi:hypothetical protein